MQTLKDITEHLASVNCKFWYLSIHKGFGQEPTPVAQFMDEEKTLGDSLSSLSETVERLSRNSPETVYSILAKEKKATNKSECLGAFEFTRDGAGKAKQTTSSLMPHDMQKMGYVPDSFVQMQMNLISKTNELALKRQEMSFDFKLEKKELERDYHSKVADLKKEREEFEIEKQELEELRTKYESKSSAIQKGVTNAGFNLLSAFGDANGFEGLKGLVDTREEEETETTTPLQKAVAELGQYAFDNVSSLEDVRFLKRGLEALIIQLKKHKDGNVHTEA